MARILIGTVPILGHVSPMLPLARALVARGHEVRWYSGSKYRGRIEATGAQFVAPVHARDYDDATIEAGDPERAALHGIARLKFDMKQPGAGINLKTATPGPAALRCAVRALLSDPSYRARAAELAAQYARHDAVARAVELIEGIADAPPALVLPLSA